MTTRTLDSELLEAQDDIMSLRGELSRLEDEKSRLLEQIENDKSRLQELKEINKGQEINGAGAIVADLKVGNTNVRAAFNGKGTAPEIDNIDQEIGQINQQQSNSNSFDDILEHKYFDKSIQQLMVSLGKRQQRVDDFNTNPDNNQFTSLTESILRFTGLTAFPIDQVHMDEELLGLRFDIFTEQRFQTPHYVILGKTATKGNGPDKWTIFRHTLPAFVPLDEYSELLDDVSTFARAVRRFLVRIQYNHDKFARIRFLSWLVTSDLRCELVLLVKDGVTISITCGLEEIENVEVKGLDSAKKSYVEAKLWRCSVANLMKTMRKINV